MTYTGYPDWMDLVGVDAQYELMVGSFLFTGEPTPGIWRVLGLIPGLPGSDTWYLERCSYTGQSCGVELVAWSIVSTRVFTAYHIPYTFGTNQYSVC